MIFKAKFVNGLKDNECHITPVITLTYPDEKNVSVRGFGLALEFLWFAVLFMFIIKRMKINKQ